MRLGVNVFAKLFKIGSKLVNQSQELSEVRNELLYHSCARKFAAGPLLNMI